MHTFLQVQPFFGLKVFDACVGFQQNGVPLLQHRHSILSHICVSPKGGVPGCPPPPPSWPNILWCGHIFWLPSPFLSALGETLHMYIYYTTIMPGSQWESFVGKCSWYKSREKCYVQQFMCITAIRQQAGWFTKQT